jgi:hypothetical protein
LQLTFYGLLIWNAAAEGEDNEPGDAAFAEPERHDRIFAHVSRCESTYSFNATLKKSGVDGSYLASATALQIKSQKDMRYNEGVALG